MRRRHVRYLIALAVLLAALGVRYWTGEGHQAPNPMVVTRVIDGDTAELGDKEMVRLLGIDTPEKGEPFYDSAKVFLRKMVLNRTVSLRYDKRKRDSYGRLLAYIYLDDTLLVNEAILTGGLGRMYIFPDNKSNQPVIDRLLTAQRRAMDSNRGIWSLPHIASPYYVANRQSMRFHRPECESVQKLSERQRIVYKTREAACYGGLSPCRNCQP